MENFDTNKKRKYFRFADVFIALVIIASVVMSSLLIFSPDDTSLVAVVTVDGEVYREVSLESVEGDYNLLIDEKGVALHFGGDGVCFVYSDCKDKLCVNTGVLNKAGQSAVCLPQRVAVRLVSADAEGLPDAVVG